MRARDDAHDALSEVAPSPSGSRSGLVTAVARLVGQAHWKRNQTKTEGRNVGHNAKVVAHLSHIISSLDQAGLWRSRYGFGARTSSCSDVVDIIMRNARCSGA